MILLSKLKLLMLLIGGIVQFNVDILPKKPFILLCRSRFFPKALYYR